MASARASRASWAASLSEAVATGSLPARDGWAALLGLARLNGNATLRWLAAEVDEPARWRDLAWDDPSLLPTPPAGLPGARRFANTDWGVLRSGWRWGEDMALVLSSGFRTGHSHLDANHLLLDAFGETLLTDPGRKHYTPEVFAPGGKARPEWTSTRGHNTVLIDELGQTALAQGRGSTLRACLDGPYCSYLVSEAADAYPEKAERVLRTVLFVAQRYFVVLDDLRAGWPAVWEARYHCAGTVDVEDQRQASAAGTLAGLRLVIEGSPGVALSQDESADAGPCIRATTTSPAPRARLLTVAYPYRISDATARAPDASPSIVVQRTEDGGFALEVGRGDGIVDAVTWTLEGDEGRVTAVTRRAGELTGFFAAGSRGLTSGAPVFASDQPLDISGRADSTSIQVAVDAGQTGVNLVLFIAPARVRELGLDGAAVQVSPDAGGRGVQVRVPAGVHRLDLALRG